MNYIKYKKKWWEVKSRTLDNATICSYEGVKKHHVDLREFEIVEASSFDELDWTNTEVYNFDSKFGWLDREGNFYGCDFACHSDQAMFIHKKSSFELERLGWIHISALSPTSTSLFADFFGNYQEGVIPTDKQLEYLISHPEIKTIDSVKKAVANGNYAKAQIYESKLKNKQKDEGREL